MAGFEPTAQEQQVIKAVFSKADTQDLGVITGDEAVKIFAGSGLSPTTLGEIWQLSDTDNNGFLTEAGLGIAIRLIGWAQAGESPKKELISRVGPLPTIKGIPIPGVSSNPGSPMPRSPPPSLPARPVMPPLTPEDRQKFLRMFFQSGPSNGLLSGDKARDLFVKSKLPTEKLSHIWHLADTHERGSLDSTDFIIGMFLIQAAMTGQLQILPPSLPPGLYEQASGGAPRPSVGSPLQAQFTGTSSSSRTAGFPQRAASPIRTQYTGQAPLEPQYTGTHPRIAPQYTGQSQFGRPPAPPPPVRPQITGQPFAIPQASPFAQPKWDVTPEEKAKSDQFFAGLDPQGRGFIEGDVAVNFMVQSKLPEVVLAQVWDLSDLNKDGKLTRDGFAVAMHLINGKLAGREIPSELPQSLIPPSYRGAASAPAPAAAPTQSETLRDLWSLDEPVQTPTPPVPAPAPAPAPVPAPAKPQRNLFDDDEDESPSPATATSSAPPNGPAATAAATHSIEIANVQNQLASTQRALDSATAARQAASASADAGAAELASLKEQLARATAARANEETHLNEIRARKVAQDAELTKVREELIRVESEVSAIRLERGELETSLLRDKEELRGVQKKVREVSEETERAKGEVEKFKREARQVKGLLAIARKQLGTTESEKLKVEKEGEEARNETEEARQELEEVERQVAQAESSEPSIAAPVPTVNGAHPLPGATLLSPQSTGIDRLSPAQVELPASRAATPAAPQRTASTNPFDRLRGMSGSGGALPFVDVPTGTSPFTGTPFGSNPTSPTVASPFSAPETPFGGPEAAFAAAPQTAFAPVPEPASSAPEAPSAPAAGPSAFDAVFGDAFGEAPKEKQGSFSNIVTETTAEVTPKPPLAPIAQPSTHGPADDEDPFGMGAEEKHDEVKVEETPKEEPKHEEKPKVEEDKPKEDDKAKEEDPVFAAAASQFPALSVQNSPNTHDLPPLTELEPQEEDSDSDDEPLDKKAKRLTVKQGDLGTAPLAAMAGAGEAAPAPAPAPASVPAPAPAPAPLATSAFDNAFGLSAPSAAPAATGASAFDEAFKSIPSNHEDTKSSGFSFQNSFDDNFDFASATSKDKDTNTTATPVVPGGFSFDDAFGTSSVTSNGTGTGTGKGVSFDEAFGVSSKSDTGSAKPSFDAFGSSSFTTPAPARTSVPAPEPVPVPAPVHRPGTASSRSRPSPPTSPTSASVRSGRASSPRNNKRSESPKPTPRTQLSPPPEPGQRLSKFNIHLPSFGRSKTTKDKTKGKKGKEQIPDMPPPPAGPPAGATSGTPAVDDDVEAVKTLCGMGFSRTQAVNALETHGYDVQRALNSLLGS